MEHNNENFSIKSDENNNNINTIIEASDQIISFEKIDDVKQNEL